ncbi:MAG: UDP-N-acetylmuramyl-tripeptide synthetase [Candidatus Magasanikbacteria bacterium]|nr:UDP-N-acetylmuramyl-tripeptide synthetase [Candidatus Magasanikbacteria bacterium]
MIAMLRKIVPQPVFRAYHYLMSVSGAVRYGYPTKKMITIGITGTSGKSTTVFLLGRILNDAGHKVGSSSTIEFCIGDECKLNKTKMTQLGRWGTQAFLSRMQKEGCDVAIVETTSQGIEQFRHLGIFYDVCLLTNLYPEHIESHGSFENYKNAKKRLFTYLAYLPIKENFHIPKTAVVNGAVAEAEEFIDFPIDRKWAHKKAVAGVSRAFVAQDTKILGNGVEFILDGVQFFVPLLGEHVVDNAIAACSVAVAIGVSLEACAASLKTITAVPGRTEFISEGQPFKVLIDFAFEPVAMTNLYEVISKIPHERVIHVLGGTGGGRDKARRPKIGKIAAEHAALVVVTNEDPYDEDPREIIEMVASGVRAGGKTEANGGLEIVDDRRAAILFALQKAAPGDIVLITGKGCEQAIVGPNRTMTPWDDRAVVRESLKQINTTWQSQTQLN